MRDSRTRTDGRTDYVQWPDTADGDIEIGTWGWVETVPARTEEITDEETGETYVIDRPAEGEWQRQVTTRAMTEAEVAEWHVRNPPPPLVAEPDRLDEDRLNAFVALLYEDSVKLQYIIGAAAQGRPLDVALLMEADAYAVSKLASRADDREALDEMTRARVARAEAVRQSRGE